MVVFLVASAVAGQEGAGVEAEGHTLGAGQTGAPGGGVHVLVAPKHHLWKGTLY